MLILVLAGSMLAFPLYKRWFDFNPYYPQPPNMSVKSVGSGILSAAAIISVPIVAVTLIDKQNNKTRSQISK